MENLIKRTDLVTGQHVYAPNYHIMIEPVYGCNRRCSFCACDFTKFHLMSEEVFEAVLSNIDHNTKRMTWNLCGESTLHPNLVSMVARAKKKAPKAQFVMITNGDVKVTAKKDFAYFSALVNAGMDLIHYDLYDPEDEPVVAQMIAEAKDLPFEVKFFGEGEGSFWGQNNKKPEVVIMPSQFGVNRPNLTNIKFNTQAGCTPYETWEKFGVDGKKFPIKRACKEPMKYVVVCWDGSYALCCADHGRPTNYGNILTLSVKDYWVSKKHRMAQLALSEKRRDLVPSCYYCDKLSFRDGLFPYPFVETFKGSDFQELYEASKLTGKMLNNFKKIDSALGIKSHRMKTLYVRSLEEEKK